MSTEIALLIVLIILSAIFSGTETAMFSLSNIKVRNMVKQGRKGAKILRNLKEDPNKLLVTILVGNNIVNIAASAIATVVATKYVGSDSQGIGIAIATGVMTFLLLVFGEITPKAFAHQNAEKISLIMAPPLTVLKKTLNPVIWFLEKITNGIIDVIGGKAKSRVITYDEIRTTITVGREEGLIEKDEEEMLHNVFDFKEATADQIMIPRTEIFALESKTKIREVVKILDKNPYTRIPVYKDNLDNIIGVLYTKDLIRNMKAKKDDDTIEKVIRHPYFIPETKNLNQLMKEFRKKRIHMAIVVSESGGVEGLVTLEDIIEEIVGEIYDETDESETLIKKTKDSYEIEGRAEIDHINKILNINLEEEYFNTIAGYIIHKLGRIPETGENLLLDNMEITILEADDQKISRLKVKLLTPE